MFLGFTQNTYRLNNAVEVYDHLADTWSHTPNMVEEGSNHSLLAINSKLFVVGRSFEVCDSLNKNFVLLIKLSYDFSLVIGAISIENKILVFQVSWFPKDTSIFFVRH